KRRIVPTKLQESPLLIPRALQKPGVPVAHAELVGQPAGCLPVQPVCRPTHKRLVRQQPPESLTREIIFLQPRFNILETRETLAPTVTVGNPLLILTAWPSPGPTRVADCKLTQERALLQLLVLS